MISSTFRRATATTSITASNISRRALSRAYTIPASKPIDAQENQDKNPLHALYNNENQSVDDKHLKSEIKDAKQRTLSEEEQEKPEQINSVFDE